jgi:UDP-3-O-acyl N-acetylglucosamine deacetylase
MRLPPLLHARVCAAADAARAGTLPVAGPGVRGAAPPDAAAVDAALLKHLRRTLAAERAAAAAVPDHADGDAAPGTAADAPPPAAPPAVDETPRGRSVGELRIPASAASLPSLDGANNGALQLRTVLAASVGGRSASVSTVEHLLAALEACGVDNAAVEAQGSGEAPILDGSAAPWVEAIAGAGVTLARGSRGGPPRARRALRLAAPLTVGDGESYVSYVPGPVTRLTAGIDFMPHTPVIGRQWASWCPSSDAHFYVAVAAARTFTTMPQLRAARAAGLIRGGSLDCALVADGRRWVNAPERVRAEPATHKLLDLLGDVALAAAPGQAGLPLGHITAYRAGHALHARFVAALAAAARDAPPSAWVAVPRRGDNGGGG